MGATLLQYLDSVHHQKDWLKGLCIYYIAHWWKSYIILCFHKNHQKNIYEDTKLFSFNYQAFLMLIEDLQKTAWWPILLGIFEIY